MIASMNAAELAARPLFAQIEARLRQRILGNALPPGSKLPSEAQLEVEFKVSRITVRQALAALHAGGLIRKVNGKGSFVTRPSDAPDLGPLTGFYEHMRARGHRTHGQTLSVREGRVNAQAAQALRLPPGTALTAVTVVRRVDGKPLAIGTTYGKPELIHALLREDMETNDVQALLESRLGIRLKAMHTETSALAAGKLRARYLEMAPEDPVLRIRFTPHDSTDQPVCYSEMFFRGDAFSYKAVVKR